MATRIFVAGHKGMVGSAIVRNLSKDPEVTLLLAERSELDLRDGEAMHAYMQTYIDMCPSTYVYMGVGRKEAGSCCLSCPLFPFRFFANMSCFPLSAQARKSNF